MSARLAVFWGTRPGAGGDGGTEGGRERRGRGGGGCGARESGGGREGTRGYVMCKRGWVSMCEGGTGGAEMPWGCRTHMCAMRPQHRCLSEGDAHESARPSSAWFPLSPPPLTRCSGLEVSADNEGDDHVERADVRPRGRAPVEPRAQHYERQHVVDVHDSAPALPCACVRQWWMTARRANEQQCEGVAVTRPRVRVASTAPPKPCSPHWQPQPQPQPQSLESNEGRRRKLHHKWTG
jgi:hypothetical protein